MMSTSWPEKLILLRKAFYMLKIRNLLLLTSVLLLNATNLKAADTVPTEFVRFEPSVAARNIINQNVDAAAKCENPDPQFCINANEPSAIACDTNCPDCMKAAACIRGNFAEESISLSGSGQPAIKAPRRTTD